MKKFNEYYNKILEETRREYLTLAEIRKLYDDVVRSEGMESYFNKMSDGYQKNIDNKLELLTAAVVNAFENTGINAKYRQDLENDDYQMLIDIADKFNLWQSGQNYGNQAI